ncbi:MAG TPA: GlsB/YeaQ/YmgE family stress response membrane protein [Acidimicrobiales bacterium]|nr:GlsB/YeaQ/YmgE family stress response membrane protein [Acidimicrobiales bacterium]
MFEPRRRPPGGFGDATAGYMCGMALLGWIVIGLIAGFLARLIVPGRDPMGLLATLALGLIGSIVGGLLAKALFHDPSVGWFGSTVGAVIVLLVWNALVRNRRRGVAGYGRRMMS